MSGDAKDDMVVVASMKALRSIACDRAGIKPAGDPAAEKKDEVASAFAWNVTPADVEANPDGMASDMPVPVTIPPVEAATLLAARADMVDEPTQPGV